MWARAQTWQLDAAGNVPNTNKVNWNFAAESGFEPRGKGFVALTCRLEELVREGDSLHIVFREQADLHGKPSSTRTRLIEG